MMLEQLPAIWTWDAVSEVEAYPQEPTIVMTVVGNCGIEHSFEEWRACSLCKHPKSVDYAWWRQPWAPTPPQL